MPVFKKNLTPLGKGGQIVKHAGKGSAFHKAPGEQDPFAPSTLGGSPASRTMNDYAKATPMANPAPLPPDGSGLGG